MKHHAQFHFDGSQVEIAAQLVQELDADAKQLRVVKLTDIIHQLADCGIVGRATRTFAELAVQAGQPDADPFDLLCHLAFNAPVLTRRQRADRLKRQELAFFDYLKPEAQEVLNELPEKYATDGELQFVLPDVLKVPPIAQHGSVGEIVGVFGGPDELHTAVNHLQELLYAP